MKERYRANKQKLKELITTELTGLTRSVKRSSLNGKDKTITRNKNIYENKNLTDKSKYIVKAVD